MIKCKQRQSVFEVSEMDAGSMCFCENVPGQYGVFFVCWLANWVNMTIFEQIIKDLFGIMKKFLHLCSRKTPLLGK